MTGAGPGAPQDPNAFGIGRLFFLTSEAIVAADLRTERIVLWNPAAEQVFGYTAEEALDRPLADLVPDSLRAEHRAGIQRYAGGGEAVLAGKAPVVVPALTKSGEARDVSLTITDVSDGDERRFVLAVIRDVTAQVAAEQEAAAATAAMQEFVAIASHDLRSPLASVLGFAKLLADSSDELGEERRRTCTDAIERGARQAARLVEDLLTLSQVTADVVSTEREPVVLAEAARQAVGGTGVEATVHIDDHLEVLADREHLRRILVNYLVNAEHHGAPPVRITAELVGDQVVVRVHDGGPGVPEDFEQRLFTSFARADLSDRRGTGLGLSIVQGLATANRGQAFYDGRDGSCFGVSLPVAP